MSDDIIRLTGAAGEFDYRVLSRNRFGSPLKVECVEPYMRGSFIEASANAHFAVHNMGAELLASLTPALRRFAPKLCSIIHQRTRSQSTPPHIDPDTSR